MTEVHQNTTLGNLKAELALADMGALNDPGKPLTVDFDLSQRAAVWLGHAERLGVDRNTIIDDAIVIAGLSQRAAYRCLRVCADHEDFDMPLDLPEFTGLWEGQDDDVSSTAVVSPRAHYLSEWAWYELAMSTDILVRNGPGTLAFMAGCSADRFAVVDDQSRDTLLQPISWCSRMTPLVREHVVPY